MYASAHARYTVYMEMIAGFFRSRKGRELLLAATLGLLAVISFGLGRLSAFESRTPPVALVMRDPAVTTAAQTSSDSVLPTDVSSNEKVVAETAVQTHAGMYVASKSGSVYHLPWCSGAKRIKDENKIWFASKDEAERAGYRPAANCKGI